MVADYEHGTESPRKRKIEVIVKRPRRKRGATVLAVKVPSRTRGADPSPPGSRTRGGDPAPSPTAPGRPPKSPAPLSDSVDLPSDSDPD